MKDLRRMLAELGELDTDSPPTPEELLEERRERWEIQKEIWREKIPLRKPRRKWSRCGARCRDGHLCRAPPVRHAETGFNRNGRCRMHGGLSTGPRTPEGKARVAQAARKMMLERWKAKRAASGGR